MKYVHFITNNLRDLADPYKGGSFPWNQIGTTAKAINLDAIDGGNMTEGPDGETAYLLPIVNEVATKNFIEMNLKPFGVTAEILTEDKAIKQWEKYKAVRAKAKATYQQRQS